MLKILGWVLLIGGLVLIVWALFRSYLIFTAKAEAPEFFKIEQQVKNQVPSSGKTGSQSAQEIQAQIDKMIGEQLQGILPANSITKTLNLTVWSMLAFIMLAGGGQIAGLGIRLIKK